MEVLIRLWTRPTRSDVDGGIRVLKSLRTNYSIAK